MFVATWLTVVVFKAHSGTDQEDRKFSGWTRALLGVCLLAFDGGGTILAKAANGLHLVSAPWTGPELLAMNIALPLMCVSLAIGIRRLEATPVLETRFTWKDARDITVFMAGFAIAVLATL